MYIMLYMKKDTTPYVNAVLAGASLGSQAKLSGLNVNTIRRDLIKHPDYEKAKAAGLLHQKGYDRVNYPEADVDRGIELVVAGSTVAAASEASGVPVHILTVRLKEKHPGYSVRYREATKEELAQKMVDKAQRMLRKAQKLANAASKP